MNRLLALLACLGLTALPVSVATAGPVAAHTLNPGGCTTYIDAPALFPGNVVHFQASMYCTESGSEAIIASGYADEKDQWVQITTAGGSCGSGCADTYWIVYAGYTCQGTTPDRLFETAALFSFDGTELPGMVSGYSDLACGVG